MHATSTFKNSLAIGEPGENTSKGEVLVLHYKKQSVLIPAPEKYENLLENATHVSGLQSEDIQITTADLDICVGKYVVISPQAWPLVWKIVANITVSKPSEKVMKDEELKEEVDVDASISEIAAYEEPLSRHGRPRESISHRQRRGSFRRSSYHGEPEDEEEQYVEDDLVAEPTPINSPLKREPTTSPYVRTPIIQSPQTPSRRHASHTTRVSKRSLMARLSANYSPRTPRASGANVAGPSAPPVVAPPLSVNSSVADLTPASETSALPNEAPDWLTIFIEFQQVPAGEDLPSQAFRVRPKYTVAKIIRAAAKAFNLDGSKATLKQVVLEDVDDKTGMPLDRCVICNVDDTIAGLPTQDNQKFIIELKE